MAPPIDDTTTQRRAQVFSALTEQQFKLMLRYGGRRDVPAGTVLFRQGERHRWPAARPLPLVAR